MGHISSKPLSRQLVLSFNINFIRLNLIPGLYDVVITVETQIVHIEGCSNVHVGPQNIVKIDKRQSDTHVPCE